MIHVPHTCKYCHHWNPQGPRAISTYGICTLHPQSTFDGVDVTLRTVPEFSCDPWTRKNYFPPQPPEPTEP